jgi:hypothetical protein
MLLPLLSCKHELRPAGRSCSVALQCSSAALLPLCKTATEVQQICAAVPQSTAAIATRLAEL